MAFLSQQVPVKSAKTKATQVKVLRNIKGKFSIIFSGAKGTSKSTTAYGINDGVGQFIVLDFDGNSTRVVNLVVDPTQVSNFKIYNIKDKIDFVEIEDPTKVPIKAYKVYEYVEDIIYKQLPNLDPAPNFIIFDGFQRWVWICEMAMRNVHMKGQNPFTDGGNWNMWKERNFYVDRSFQGAMNITSDAVLITVHEVEKERKVIDEDKSTKQKAVYKTEPYREPNWMSTVKEEIDIVVESNNTSLGALSSGSSYIQNIKSNKVTGKEGAVDVTDDVAPFWDLTLGAPKAPLIKKR